MADKDSQTTRITCGVDADITPGIILPTGTKLKHYRLQRKVGQGGFGITYLAEHMQSHELVVIKENMPTVYAYRDAATLRIRPLDDDSAEKHYAHTLQRFVEEARTLARLNHPNIVRVYEAFEAFGTAYYVMPLVTGKELHKAVPSVVNEAWLTPILKTILVALDYLHSQNLLHRDIKPGNILLTEEGTPILIDFGTARDLQSERTATIIGTPGYTPLEQLTSHGKLGPWTDIYALGATCYRLITGDCPPQAVERVDDDDPYIPLASRTELKGKFSQALLQSIDKALAVRAKKRWQSAQDWLSALKSSASSVPANTVTIPLAPINKGKDRTSFLTIPLSSITKAPNQPIKKKPVTAGIYKHIIIGLIVEAIFAFTYGAYSCLTSFTKDPTTTISPSWQFREYSYIQQLENTYKKQVVLTKDQLPKPESVELVSNLHTMAERGDAKAQWAMGILLLISDTLSGTHDTEAAKWFRKAAEQGNAYAQIELGDCYLSGKGVDKNESEGVKWIRKAADQGCAVGHVALGVCYMLGTDVNQDATEAVKWFRKAADQGCAVGQAFLGLCYIHETGVNKDAAEGVRWIRKAADQGCAVGQIELGNCYLEGTGVNQDATEGVRWIRKAADQGNANGQIALGNCYLEGTGVNQDAAEAVKWFRKAAEQNEEEAQYQLGICYLNGIGVEKDEAKAVEWLHKAAEQENADAQCMLGVCYYYGKGVIANEPTAVEWFRKAAQQGNEDAQKWLKRLGKNQ